MRVLRSARYISSFRNNVAPQAPKLYRYDRTLVPELLTKFRKPAELSDFGAIPEGRIIAKNLSLGAEHFSTQCYIATINPQLCDACRLIIQGTNQVAEDVLGTDYHGDFYKHLDVATIRHNAFCGCSICTILWNRYSAAIETVKGFDLLPLYFDYGVWWRAKSRAYAIRFYVFGRQYSQKNSDVQLLSTIVVTLDAMFCPSEVATVQDKSIADTGTSRHMKHAQSSTGSLQSLEKIKAWLDKCTCCETRHVDGAEEQTGFIPKRLVEIDMQQSGSMRVVNGDSFSSTVRYITLSHCWGHDTESSAHIRLLQSNLAKFEAGIDTSLLPKTFQDAVAVARFLNVSHIWIDSLCIIQDSHRDWEENAVVMGDVYQNAYLTLAATASTSSAEGLFRTRPCATISQCAVEVPEHTVFNRDKYAVYSDDDWSVFVDNAPLNKRAWALQERLLSPRVVHFAQNQLYFECLEFRASEQYPLQLPDRVYSSKIRPRFSLQRKELDESLVVQIWSEIVSEYSSLQLSFTSDKKVAISGISNKIKSVTATMKDSAYFAGQWNGWLEAQLSWETATESKRATDRVVPSWSWLSIDGPVRPYFLPFTELLEPGFLKVIPEVMVNVELDEVKDSTGYLAVSGPVFRLSGIRAKPREDRFFPPVSFAKAKQNLVERIARSRPGYSDENLITIGFSESGLPCGATGLDAKTYDYVNGLYITHSRRDQIEGPAAEYAPLRRFEFDIGGFYAADSAYRDTAQYDHEAEARTGEWKDYVSDTTAKGKTSAPPLHARYPLFEHTLPMGPKQLVGEMVMDEDFECAQLEKMEPLFVPLYSMCSTEFLEIDHLKGLVVVETDGRYSSTYRRIGVATLGNEETCAFLCALGNQEQQGSLKPINSYIPPESLERKDMKQMIPDTWAWQDMEYLPKDFTTHMIWIK